MIARLMLVKGTGLISWLIKRETGSIYSHCCWLIGDRTFEIDRGGFSSSPLVGYPLPYDLFTVDGLDENNAVLLQRWCLAHKDAHYDYGKVLGQGLDLILHVSGFRSILNSKRAMSCAEWVYNSADAMGIRFQKNQANLYPGDLCHDPLVHRVGIRHPGPTLSRSGRSPNPTRAWSKVRVSR